MFCPECGTQNANDAIFCAGCGTRLAAEQPVQQPICEAPVEAPACEAPVQVPVYEVPVQPQQPVYQVPVQPQQPVYQQPYQPAYQQSYQPYQAYQKPADVPGKGIGIAGMILGIASLVCCCEGIIAGPCALIGLILSIVGVSKASKAGAKNGFAIAGIVCASIGLIFAALYLLIFIGSYDEIMNEMNDYAQYY